MKWLAEASRILFPYRSHLESEVEYLKGQLAQRERRIDELMARTLPSPKEPRREPPPLPKTPPKGWDAYRASRKQNGQKDAETDDHEGEAVLSSTKPQKHYEG